MIIPTTKGMMPTATIAFGMEISGKYVLIICGGTLRQMNLMPWLSRVFLKKMNWLHTKKNKENITTSFSIFGNGFSSMNERTPYTPPHTKYNKKVSGDWCEEKKRDKKR